MENFVVSIDVFLHITSPSSASLFFITVKKPPVSSAFLSTPLPRLHPSFLSWAEAHKSEMTPNVNIGFVVDNM